MELEFTLLFLSAALGHAGALRCYKCSGTQCNNGDVEQCKDGGLCMTRLDRQSGGDKLITKSCETRQRCTNASLNLGYLMSEISCCNTDLCNTGPDPEKLSGLKCVGCLQVLNDFKCNRTGVIPCTGNQNKCGRLKGVHKADGRTIPIDFQGCVSESVCFLTSNKLIFGIEIGKQFECCDGDLCNSSPGLEAGPVTLLLLCLCLLLSNNN